MLILKYKIIASPVGNLKIVVQNRALAAILWENERLDRVKLDEMKEDPVDPLILETERQLREYFAGQRTDFDLPLNAVGTAFQQKVWHLLSEIPYGTTTTYKDIATKMHKPLACRAVGTAIGRNPISIVIPCHRVIGSDGGLAGFAGGLDRKRILLDLEG